MRPGVGPQTRREDAASAQPTWAPGDPEVAAYVERLIAEAARQTLPELFARPHPGALYRVPERHGVSVTVIRTADLAEEQLVKILRYRLAQYLSVGFLNAGTIYEAAMEHEPSWTIGSADVHVVAGSAATGEILCYATLRALADAPPEATLRTRARPLFPVEAAFGWGIYGGLRVLPELPAARVREVGRFAKNQRLRRCDELAVRAPVETSLATFRALTGPLRGEVEAVVGELEEHVAKRNLDYFHVPTVLVRGAVPRVRDDSYVSPHYRYHAVYPFAFLTADLPAARLAAVEAALAQPGRRGVAALLVLKRDTGAPRSALLPADYSPPLMDENCAAHRPQPGTDDGAARPPADGAGAERCVEAHSGWMTCPTAPGRRSRQDRQQSLATGSAIAAAGRPEVGLEEDPR